MSFWPLTGIYARLDAINDKLEKLMSTSDEIAADTASLQATDAAIQTAVANAMTHILALEAAVAAGTPVDPAVLAALKAEVASIATTGGTVTPLATA